MSSKIKNNRKIYNCKQCGEPVTPWKTKYLEFRHICKKCKKKSAITNIQLAVKARKDARKEKEKQSKKTL